MSLSFLDVVISKFNETYRTHSPNGDVQKYVLELAETEILDREIRESVRAAAIAVARGEADVVKPPLTASLHQAVKDALIDFASLSRADYSQMRELVSDGEGQSLPEINYDDPTEEREAPGQVDAQTDVDEFQSLKDMLNAPS